MNDNPRAKLEFSVFGKVYELLLSHPIRAAFRQDESGAEDEPPAQDPELLVAVQADRFDLGVAVRELREAAQQELFAGEFTDTARCALLWVLWHHQGASSPVGQAMRFALGMGQHDELSGSQVADASRWATLNLRGLSVPWGAWTPGGDWHHNPALRMSAAEQRAASEAAGYACPGTDGMDSSAKGGA